MCDIARHADALSLCATEVGAVSIELESACHELQKLLRDPTASGLDRFHAKFGFMILGWKDKADRWKDVASTLRTECIEPPQEEPTGHVRHSAAREPTPPSEGRSSCPVSPKIASLMAASSKAALQPTKAKALEQEEPAADKQPAEALPAVRGRRSKFKPLMFRSAPDDGSLFDRTADSLAGRMRRFQNKELQEQALPGASFEQPHLHAQYSFDDVLCGRSPRTPAVQSQPRSVCLEHLPRVETADTIPDLALAAAKP